MGRPWWYDDRGWGRRTGRPRMSRRQWVWVVIAAVSFLLAAAGTGFRPVPIAWLLGFTGYFCQILAIAVLINAVLSWFRPSPYSWPVVILADITDPVLQPLRRLVPPVGGFDFTPLIAIMALYFIPSVIRGLVYLVI